MAESFERLAKVRSRLVQTCCERSMGLCRASVLQTPFRAILFEEVEEHRCGEDLTGAKGCYTSFGRSQSPPLSYSRSPDRSLPDGKYSVLAHSLLFL